MRVCDLRFYKLCGYFAATKRSADDVRLGNMPGRVCVLLSKRGWANGKKAGWFMFFAWTGGPLERTTTAGLHLSRFAGVCLCVCVLGRESRLWPWLHRTDHARSAASPCKRMDGMDMLACSGMFSLCEDRRKQGPCTCFVSNEHEWIEKYGVHAMVCTRC